MFAISDSRQNKRYNLKHLKYHFKSLDNFFYHKMRNEADYKRFDRKIKGFICFHFKQFFLHYSVYV